MSGSLQETSLRELISILDCDHGLQTLEFEAHPRRILTEELAERLSKEDQYRKICRDEFPTLIEESHNHVQQMEEKRNNGTD